MASPCPPRLPTVARLLLLLGMVLLPAGSFRPANVPAGRPGAAIEEAIRSKGEARVIVTLRSASKNRRPPGQLIDDVLRGAPRAEIEPEHALMSAPVFIARVTGRGLGRLLADARVSQVDLDGEIRGADDLSAQQIGADRVHAMSILGQGVTVAVLDSGTDVLENPDLDPALIGEECFCSRFGGCCPNGTARQSGPGSAHTITVHGPGVMGIIASQGVNAPLGIAPGARIFMVRVLDDNLIAEVSDILLALDWVVSHADGIRVINMSIAGGPYAAPCDQAGAFNEGVALLSAAFREKGGLMVAASGNDSNPQALGSPACVSSVISVGAVNSLDQVEAFSDADASLDLLAPGRRILTDSSFGRVEELTGTSASAPHVAGAIALLLSANGALTPEAIEARLKTHGVPIIDPRNQITFPRVDVFHALALPMDVAIVPAALPVASRGRGLQLRLEPRLPVLATDIEPETLTVSLAGGPEVSVDSGSARWEDADGNGVVELAVSVDRRQLLAGSPGAENLTVQVQGQLRSGVGVLGTSPLALFEPPRRVRGLEPTP